MQIQVSKSSLTPNIVDREVKLVDREVPHRRRTQQMECNAQLAFLICGTPWSTVSLRVPMWMLPIGGSQFLRLKLGMVRVLAAIASAALSRGHFFCHQTTATHLLGHK